MNTTINQSELHKFVIGEIRTDGWKSDWRKNLEAPRETNRPVAVVRANNPRRRNRGTFDSVSYMRRRRQEMKDKGICVDCGENPVRPGRLTCVGCGAKRSAAQSKRYYAKKVA